MEAKQDEFYCGESNVEFEGEGQDGMGIFTKLNENIRHEMLDILEKNKTPVSEEFLYPDDPSFLEIFKTHFTGKVIRNENNLKAQHENISDPYLKITQLQKELTETKDQVEDYVKKYNDNLLIKETENFENVIEDLDSYQAKIDMCMNSDFFQKISKQNPEPFEKKEFLALVDQYSKTTQRLLSLASHRESIGGVNTQYEILAYPEMDIDTLVDNVNKLDEMVNNLEQTVGNWESFKNTDNISSTVCKLESFIKTKLQENVENKSEILQNCETMMSNLLENKTSAVESYTWMVKIKELYSILEIYEHFDQVFEYIAVRLRTIKEIYDGSDKFSNTMSKLDESISKNEEKLNVLINNYDEVLKHLEGCDGIMQEITKLDSHISDLLV